MSPFLKIIPYFHKNSLQGKNEVTENNFWDFFPTPLPKMILTTSHHPSVIPKIQSQERCDTTNENGNPSHIVPNITIFETRGESLQSAQENPNIEPLIYSRKRYHQKSRSLPIPLGNDQS
ncbi:hypothetical protein PanWU01x14_204550 [Parasponia andersonii]|uniref:Uncharacterized protein n=1 Tax=Parasponia andersonii TaxID=3476 RepID=A0A2P5BW95_PARAD|nr:hypothetical protein PanWU01x14_204550 [Parasponia andersonii]